MADRQLAKTIFDDGLLRSPEHRQDLRTNRSCVLTGHSVDSAIPAKANTLLCDTVHLETAELVGMNARSTLQSFGSGTFEPSESVDSRPLRSARDHTKVATASRLFEGTSARFGPSVRLTASALQAGLHHQRPDGAVRPMSAKRGVIGKKAGANVRCSPLRGWRHSIS